MKIFVFFDPKLLHFTKYCVKIYSEILYIGGFLMKVDLLHNKIVRDTVSDAFTRSFNDQLLPLLVEKHGSALQAVQMYEDYLADGFTADGEFYYPLTLVLNGEIKREWIKWSVAGHRKFINKVPYSYIGSDPLAFSIVDVAPAGFEDKLVGRGIYFEGGVVEMSVESSAPDKTFLVGKYSQSFIDEMNRQISKKIEQTFSISGLASSTAAISIVFAPGTYMEHVIDGVTYRRLLISARGCSARDLWIKWYSKKSDAPLTVSNNVSEQDITFELGEDVSQKIREKEYRFLVSTSADKYQAAMGRKNITEWRDLIKRIIKRGEVEKTYAPVEAEPVKEELSYKLEELLGGYKAPVEEPVAAPAEDKNSDINAMLRSLLGVAEEPAVAPTPADEELVLEEIVAAPIFDNIPTEELEDAEEVDMPAHDVVVTEPEVVAEPAPVAPEIDEQELRRQIEMEIRAKLVEEARLAAEREREALRLEREALARENERLAALAREAEEKRVAEAERLRREIEARELAEAREKERMAEAARLAVLEQKRMEEERLEEERRLAAETEQQKRFEEAARLEEERKREAERIRRDMAEKTVDDHIGAIVKEVKDASESRPEASVNYVSKNARLIFRRPVDPNITKRIHEIILTTIKYFHKEDVYIKIKATVPDSSTVNLHFVKIPENENELLVNIIKVLGGSNLGITKVILE